MGSSVWVHISALTLNHVSRGEVAKFCRFRLTVSES